MSKKHDEIEDVRSLAKKCKIVGNTIKARKDTILGIKALGKIDFLTKYCGYVFVYDNTIKHFNVNVSEEVKKARQARKEAKQHQLKDKRK